MLDIPEALDPRKVREEKGLTLEDIADAIGGKCTASAVSRWERRQGAPNTAQLGAWARALKVEPLLGNFAAWWNQPVVEVPRV